MIDLGEIIVNASRKYLYRIGIATSSRAGAIGANVAVRASGPSPLLMDFRTSATKDLSVVLDRLVQAADAAAQTARAEAAAEAQVAIDAVTAQRKEVLRALQEQTEARSALERAHAKLEAERAKLDAERNKLRDDAAALRSQLDTLRAQSETHRTQFEVQRTQLEAQRAQAETQRVEADALRDDVQALRNELNAIQNASDALLAESNAARQDLQSRLDDALHTAADLRAHAADVTSGQIETLSPEALAQAAGTPFGGTPACTLALPIDLHGDLCAVLYADDSDQPYQAFAATELRRTFALILRQLAAPLLARLPEEKKAIAELRAYAAHLVTELENAADKSAHRKGNELRRRLQDNLECARGIYAQRISSEGPVAAAAALLEEELARAARVGQATPFGRDLTAVLGAATARAEA